MVFNRRSLYVVLGSATLLVFFNNCAGGNFETYEAASSASNNNGSQGVPGAASTTTTIKQTTTTIPGISTTTTQPQATTTTTVPVETAVPYVPVEGPAKTPSSAYDGLAINNLNNLNNSAFPAKANPVYVNAAPSSGVKIETHRWSQTAGPYPLFLSNGNPSLTIAGTIKPGTYHIKLDGRGKDGIDREDYTRILVAAANPVGVSNKYPRGPTTSTTPGEFKTMNIDLYDGGKILTAGEAKAGSHVEAKAYLFEHDGQGGERIYQMDNSTMVWKINDVMLDTSCPAQKVSARSNDGGRTYSIYYKSSASAAEVLAATVYNRGFSSTEFKSGDLYVAGGTSRACRIWVHVSAELNPLVKSISGVSLGQHSNFGQVTYSLVIGN